MSKGAVSFLVFIARAPRRSVSCTLAINASLNVWKIAALTLNRLSRGKFREGVVKGRNKCAGWGQGLINRGFKVGFFVLSGRSFVV
jgi:hypothetical protein